MKETNKQKGKQPGDDKEQRSSGWKDRTMRRHTSEVRVLPAVTGVREFKLVPDQLLARAPDVGSVGRGGGMSAISYMLGSLC